MTTIVSRRLVVSTLCALGAHLALFRLYIPNLAHIVRPEPLAVQRVAVSLGARSTIENQPEQIPVTKPVAIPAPEPDPELELIIAPPGRHPSRC